MFENLCTLPLSSDLFAQALHPKEPVLAVGLSGGHVQSFRLPPVAGVGSDDEDDDAEVEAETSVLSTGMATIDTEWRTRRHKGSCRTLAYSIDGDILYSAGTDGFLKAASSSTGQVVSKFLVPFDSSGGIDPPTLLHALSPQTLLLATDSAALHLLDLRIPSGIGSKPSQTHRPHDDYISSLTPLPPSDQSTSGFSKQWVTTGGTTLAITDLRRGVLVKSDDQEEELLSSIFVGGLPSRGRGKGEKVIVGSSNGILTLWERGIWDDQDERIIVDGGRGGGESLDSLVVMPEDVGDGGKNVVVGLGDGTIRIVKLGANKVIGEPLRHDEVEAVIGLGFDVGGRLISGGGSIVKVWQEKMSLGDDDDDDEEDDSDEEVSGKMPLNGSSDAEVDPKESSDEEDSRKRKKRRKNNGPKNNGILGFEGL